MKKKYKDVYYDVPDVKTIKELVIHGVGEGKDQPLFMYDYEGGIKTSTFNDVWHDINCLGTYMFAHGIKDCNVAIIGENSYEWIIAFFANLLGKIVSVPLDPKLPAEDLAVQLNEGECKAIFYSEYYAPTVEKIKEIGAPMDTYLYIPDFQKYIDEGEKLLADGYTEYKDVVVSPEDLATIVFTSGTTGKSKELCSLTATSLPSSLLPANVSRAETPSASCRLTIPSHGSRLSSPRLSSSPTAISASI